MHFVSEPKCGVMFKRARGIQRLALNRWAEGAGSLCCALAGLSLHSASPLHACVSVGLRAGQDFYPETMQQKPHLTWEGSDGLPSGSRSGPLSAVCLYYDVGVLCAFSLPPPSSPRWVEIKMR